MEIGDMVGTAEAYIIVSKPQLTLRQGSNSVLSPI